jgi:hypothetical protein
VGRLLAESALTDTGFVVKETKDPAPNTFGTLIATKDGRRHLIEVNTRAKLKKNGEINQRYKWRGGIHPYEDASSIRKRRWIAVQIDMEKYLYRVYFGTLEQLRFKSGIPMKESDVAVYACLADNSKGTSASQVPASIQGYLKAFQKDHPNGAATGFVMMRMLPRPEFEEILAAIKQALSKHGLTATRADDKSYAPELFPNVQTYVYGCGFGIAVIERIEEEAVTPSIAMELAIMAALNKPVCLLKDRTMQKLPTDLQGHLHEDFDTRNPKGTIGKAIDKWLRTNGLIS